MAIYLREAHRRGEAFLAIFGRNPLTLFCGFGMRPMRLVRLVLLSAIAAALAACRPFLRANCRLRRQSPPISTALCMANPRPFRRDYPLSRPALRRCRFLWRYCLARRQEATSHIRSIPATGSASWCSGKKA
jgi:hypothetical protein